MRVLMISFDHTMLDQDTQGPGDTRERHIKYAQALRQEYPEGHLAVLVKAPPSTSAGPQILSDGLTLYPVPSQRQAFLYQAMRTANRLFRQQPFDLVTTQSPFDDGLLGVLLKRRFGVPLHVQMRSSFLDLSVWIQERPLLYRIFNRVGKWVCHRADSIRVVSRGEKRRLEDRFPELRGKIFALHPLANVDLFTKPATSQELGEVQRILVQHERQNALCFLFVGRLVLQKNLPTLLRAFAQVCRQNLDALLVMAGEGTLKGELQQLAVQLRIQSRVLWLGNLSLQSLRGWYAAARSVVLPSFHEGVPKVALESYLMETPVIAGPFVSAGELIFNNETGFVIHSFTDSAEFADKMAVLVDSPDLAEEMGKKGREHLLNYIFPEDEYMRRLLELWSITSGRETP